LIWQQDVREIQSPLRITGFTGPGDNINPGFHNVWVIRPKNPRLVVEQGFELAQRSLWLACSPSPQCEVSSDLKCISMILTLDSNHFWEQILEQ